MKVYLGNQYGNTKVERLLLAAKRIVSYADPALRKTLRLRRP